MSSAITHDAILIPRPKLPDGRYLVRGSLGMYPTSKPIGPLMGAEICAVCGYGLTEREITNEANASPHTAIPLVVLEGRRIAEYIANDRRRRAA